MKIKAGAVLRAETHRQVFGNPLGARSRDIAEQALAAMLGGSGIAQLYATPESRYYLLRVVLSYYAHQVTKTVRLDDRVISVERDGELRLLDFAYASDEEALAQASKLLGRGAAEQRTGSRIARRVAQRAGSRRA